MMNPFLVIPKMISELGKQGSTNDLRLLRQLSTDFHSELSRGYFDLLDKRITCDYDLDKMLDGDGEGEIRAPVELPQIYRQLRFQYFERIDFQLPSRREDVYFLQQLCSCITTLDFGTSDLRNGQDFYYVQLVRMFSEHKLKVLRMFWEAHRPTQGTLMDQILEVVNPLNITVEVTLVTEDLIGMGQLENLLEEYSNLRANLSISVNSPVSMQILTQMVTMKYAGRIKLFPSELHLNELNFPPQSEQLVTKFVQALLPWVQTLTINQEDRTTPWDLLSLRTLGTQPKFPELTYLTLWNYHGPLSFLENFPNLEMLDLEDWSVPSVFCYNEKSEEENLKAIFENLKKLRQLFMIGAPVPLGDSRFDRLQDGGNLNIYLRSLLPENCLVIIELPQWPED